MNQSDKFCIIGAGSSGLAAAKNLKEHSISFDVIERADEVGGIWYYGKPHSSIHRSTHLISSKPLTQYSDFPMPRNYPDFPSHVQAWEYLRSYAQAFGLYDRIEFNSSVERVEPAGERWQVKLASGAVRTYGAVIVANGHNWDPQYADYPGSFDGVTLHSAQYKTPDALTGKRVLVIGGGNSGCDIAVESSHHAERTFHSTRRGYFYIPRYLFGRPSDQVREMLAKLRLPVRLEQEIVAFTISNTGPGRACRLGLPKPDHKLYESHPIINSQILECVALGTVIPKPDVAELRGSRVRFKDGSEEQIDLIVFATGFHINIPFIDAKLLNWRNNRPELYMRVFHPERDNLFVVGLIQPDSGQWGLVDLQANLIAKFVLAIDRQPKKAEKFRKLKSGPQPDLGHGIRYLNSSRHWLEVEHVSYRRRLEKLIKMLS